ncbi:MAG: MFS transporter [Promethearchaeota archaeon]|nr:MAG: MFS transporter [Candidatus Lokiarchaeota archaeon]
MSEESLTTKKRALFGLSAFPDQLTYQAFTVLVFTYYFAVVGIPIFQMWIAFFTWGVWNAINDPLLGALSDRTKQKGKLGKRKFYLVISVIPLAIMMILLFTVPAGIEFYYFVFVIFLFEFVYTLFDVNVNAIFPEMFPNENQRASVNIFIKGFTMIAVILASVLPTLIISPLVPLTNSPAEVARIQSMYITAGIVLAILTVIPAIPFLKYAVDEKEELDEQFEKRPPFFESLKHTLKNKTFVKFTIGNTMVWYCFTVLLTAFPLYAVFVLGIGEDSFLVGIMLMTALLSAAVLIPLHKKIGEKYGMRNGMIIGLSLWIVSLIPFVLLTDSELSRMLAIGVFAFMGFGLAAALFYIDILHGDVIDQDALKFGVKRSASFYGINALIHRISTLLSITTIALVFSGTGWAGYDPNPGVNVILGLRLLMFAFPALALIVSIICWKFYDLHGEKLAQMREELAKHPEIK